MTRVFIFLAGCFALFACATKEQKNPYPTGAAYDYAIISTVTMMQQALFEMQKQLTDSTGGETVFKSYSMLMDSLKRDIKALPPFNKNTAYRNAAVKLGDFYKKAVSVHYEEIAKISKNLKDTSATRKLNELIATLQKEEAAADDQFVRERKEFAAKNGVKIEEPPVTATKPADSLKTSDSLRKQ